MKDYKSIEEFTFDDCFKYLRENPDSKYREIVENRFETVKAETENLDGDTFSKAKTIADLKRYLETDFPGASYYQKKHVKEAEERLRIMIKEAEENVQKEKRAKRIKIGIISALAFLALALVCWLTYQPATYLNVSPFEGEVSKYGSTIKLTYSTDANRVDINSSELISETERDDNKVYARIDTNYQDTKEGWIQFTAHTTIFGFSIGSRSKTIKIIQESGLGNFINVNKTYIEAKTRLEEGRCYKVLISTDGTSWSAETNCKWIHLREYVSGKFLEITTDDNDGKVQNGYVTVRDNNGHHKEIEIKQNGMPNEFEPEISEWYPDFFGGPKTIQFTNDSNNELTASISDYDDEEWLGVEVHGNSVRILCDHNNTEPRLGTVIVECGGRTCEIDVKQAGYRKCKKCNGSGKVGCTSNFTNPYTGAHGKLIGWDNWGYPLLKKCDVCDGTRKVDCKNCDGDGRIIANYGE